MTSVSDPTPPDDRPEVPDAPVRVAAVLERLTEFDARYQQKDVLGEGGMGTVVLSLDRQIGRQLR